MQAENTDDLNYVINHKLLQAFIDARRVGRFTKSTGRSGKETK